MKNENKKIEIYSYIISFTNDMVLIKGKIVPKKSSKKLLTLLMKQIVNLNNFEMKNLTLLKFFIPYLQDLFSDFVYGVQFITYESTHETYINGRKEVLDLNRSLLGFVKIKQYEWVKSLKKKPFYVLQFFWINFEI